MSISMENKADAATTEEVKRKRIRRNKKKRETLKNMSKKEKREYFAEKATRKLKEEKEMILKDLKKKRTLATSYWRKWKEEVKCRQSAPDIQSIKHIERQNVVACDSQVLGSGVFGTCTKYMYREIPVAVKTFRQSVHKSSVLKEATYINQMDHPNLPLLFGICTETSPFFLVCQFHGVNGNCLTFGKAAQNKEFGEVEWRSLFHGCIEGLKYLHNKSFIHRDIKADNGIVTAKENAYDAVIIDFEKMQRVGDSKKYNLSAKEKEDYRLKHPHIAPEIIRGESAPSFASDIYSFGQLISYTCKYYCIETLRLIAVKCIHGTAARRPTVNEIIVDLEACGN